MCISYYEDGATSRSITYGDSIDETGVKARTKRRNEIVINIIERDGKQFHRRNEGGESAPSPSPTEFATTTAKKTDIARPVFKNVLCNFNISTHI